MSPRNWFSLFVRLIGVWKFASALEYVVVAYDIHAGFFKSMGGTVEGQLHVAYAQFVIAIVLVFSAPFLAGLLISQQKNSNDGT